MQPEVLPLQPVLIEQTWFHSVKCSFCFSEFLTSSETISSSLIRTTRSYCICDSSLGIFTLRYISQRKFEVSESSCHVCLFLFKIGNKDWWTPSAFVHWRCLKGSSLCPTQEERPVSHFSCRLNKNLTQKSIKRCLKQTVYCNKKVVKSSGGGKYDSHRNLDSYSYPSNWLNCVCVSLRDSSVRMVTSCLRALGCRAVVRRSRTRRPTPLCLPPWRSSRTRRLRTTRWALLCCRPPLTNSFSPPLTFVAFIFLL